MNTFSLPFFASGGSLSKRNKNYFLEPNRFDFGLIGGLILLMSVGIVMVASSSVEYAGEHYADPTFIVKRQFIYLMVGLLVGAITMMFSLDFWREYSVGLLVLGLFVLLLVLLPGIGKEVNGSQRWLALGPIQIQASEIGKFCFIVFFAAYLSRRNGYIRTRWSAFFLMIGLIASIVLLLLLEPDFGTSVVLCLTLGAMMFVAGVPFLRFLLLAWAGVMGLIFIAFSSEYRRDRLTAFMDPWSDRFDNGYQLVQSLIAFGRGEIFGVGLGNSVQKALFLPESHTDFVFAVFVEEFGFFGALLLILLVVYIIVKIVLIAMKALKQNELFGAFICFGIAVMFAIQAFVNMGVASGLLPTKGLTFPFVSYGGSSLVITCALFSLIFRVNWELKHDQ